MLIQDAFVAPAHLGLSFQCIDPLFIQFMIIFKLAHLQPPMQTFLRLCSPYTGELLRRYENQPVRASVHRKERLWPRGFCDGANLRRADLERGA